MTTQQLFRVLVGYLNQHGGMHFNPFATLNPTQVQNLEHNPNFSYFLHNARQGVPLEISALRAHDFATYFLMHNPGGRLLPPGAGGRVLQPLPHR